MESRSQIEHWFHLYGDDIFNYLVYYTGHREVEDMLQEVFIKAMKGFRNYNGSAQPKTWLISIARNTATDHARKQRRRLSFFRRAEETPEPVKTPEQLALERDDLQQLYRLIQGLKPSYRDIVMLRYIQELSMAETAEVLGWSESKVSLTLHRAMKALKQTGEQEKEDELRYDSAVSEG